MAEAGRRGYRYGHPDWCNLGQGQPETGPLPGSPPRVTPGRDRSRRPGLCTGSRACGSCAARSPTSTTSSTARARHRSTASATSASAAADAPRSPGPWRRWDEVNLGHFLPDYTAYEELLDIFKLFTSIPILLEGRTGYHFGLDELRREITGRGLSALLLSNPCNPTGKVIQGEELESWVGVARELGCSLLIDEFYSHYVWAGLGTGFGPGVRGPLRGGRGHRPDRALRWAHQELALSRLALLLDRGAAAGDRGGLQQRLLPRWWRQQAAAAIGHPAAGPRSGAGRDRGHPAGLPEEARDPERGAEAGGRSVRCRAGRDLLLLGRRLRRCPRRSTMACRSFGRRWSGRSSAFPESSSTSIPASAGAGAPRGSGTTCASRLVRRRRRSLKG